MAYGESNGHVIDDDVTLKDQTREVVSPSRKQLEMIFSNNSYL